MPQEVLASDLSSLAESIDRLMAIEFRPGGAPHGIIEPLYRAARALAKEPLAFLAATQLRAAVEAGGMAYIATGHVHPVALPAGETDGPPGAVVLARALILGQGAPVTILCEEAVIPAVRGTCSAAGLVVRPREQLPLPRSVAVEAFPVEPDRAAEMARDLVVNAAAVVTIEKIGPAFAGGHRTASGTDVSADVAKVDVLVEQARAAGRLTIGIGDVGNEIGMAAIADTVYETLAAGRQVACKTETDYLIVGGCSNWGAYAMAAALAALSGDIELLHDGEMERAMIAACCAAGAVDGFSAAPTLEVDGGGWPFHAAFVELLRGIVKLSLDRRKPPRHRFGTTT
jgi:hypothetical protein